MKKFILLLFVTLLSITNAFSQPQITTIDIESNVDNQIPNGTLQFVAFLDAYSPYGAWVGIEVENGSMPSWFLIRNVYAINKGIQTYQIDLGGYTPTGRVLTKYFWPYSIDALPYGMAFGLFWKDIDGNIIVANSKDKERYTKNPNYVCSWPYSYSKREFEYLIKDSVTTPGGLQQTVFIIAAAQTLLPGVYELW